METVSTPIGSFDMDEPVFSIRELIPFLDPDTSLSERGLYGTLLMWRAFGMKISTKAVVDSCRNGDGAVSTASKSLEAQGYLSKTYVKRPNGMCSGERSWDVIVDGKRNRRTQEPSLAESRRNLAGYLDATGRGWILENDEAPGSDGHRGFSDSRMEKMSECVVESCETPGGDGHRDFSKKASDGVSGTSVEVGETPGHDGYRGFPDDLINESSRKCSGPGPLPEGLSFPVNGLWTPKVMKNGEEVFDTVRVLRRIKGYSFICGRPQDTVERLAEILVAGQRGTKYISDQRKLCRYYTDQLLARNPSIDEEFVRDAFYWVVEVNGKTNYASTYLVAHWEDVEERMRSLSEERAGYVPDPEKLARVKASVKTLTM